MEKFTQKEIEAIKVLENGKLAPADVKDCKKREWFETGVNTRVLRSLTVKGAASMVFVRGGLVADVKILIGSKEASDK